MVLPCSLEYEPQKESQIGNLLSSHLGEKGAATLLPAMPPINTLRLLAPFATKVKWRKFRQLDLPLLGVGGGDDLGDALDTLAVDVDVESVHPLQRVFERRPERGAGGDVDQVAEV